MRDWSPTNPFEEKQDETADVVVLPSESLDLHTGPIHLVDAKTYQEERRGRPPNIISALKLAHMCKDMIDSDNFGSHDISYLSVAWVLENGRMRITDSTAVALFQEEPGDLYINWSAGLQVQFHPQQCPQAFAGSAEDWCRAYLPNFVDSVKNRIVTMRSDYVRVFEPYV